jgi:NTP pyrophosphatase (non-canonical NTP hydrolase)
MNFNEYQEKARGTAIYPNLGNNIYYPTLGLCGESGEVAEKIKKVMRDNNGIISEEKKEEIKKEIGDVLWYIASLCSELGFTMEEAAKANIEKLYSRKERGVIKGSGDNR